MGKPNLGGAFEGTQGGKQYKERITPKRGKRKDEIPSWAEGNKPYVGESGNEFAKRICDLRYGKGNYDKGARSDYSKLKKYADTHFEKNEIKKKRKKQ